MKPVSNINDAIDRRICFHLRNYPADLLGKTTGIFDSQGWTFAKLRGADQHGIWVENPGFRITWLKEKGNAIPFEQRKESAYVASVLILWDHISAIISLDDDEVEKEIRTLGFAAASD